MGLIERIVGALVLRRAGAVASHTFVAALAGLLWANPVVLGESAAGDLEPLLMLEFIVLHSTAFLVGFRFVKDFPTWVFLLVYAPFGILIGAQLSPLVTVLFFWHLAVGIWGDIDMAEREIGGFLVRYIPVFLWFALCPFIVVLLGLPPLGWEGHSSLAFRTDEGFYSEALIPAWATMYFLGRAVWEVAVRHWETTGDLGRFITRVRAS